MTGPYNNIVGGRLGTSFGLVAMAKMPMPILYCLRQSQLAPEKLILNLFVWGLCEKSTTIQVLDVSLFWKVDSFDQANAQA